MKQMLDLRRLLEIGLIWGILWAALAMIVGTAIALVDPSDIDRGEEPIVLAPMIALVGFICGVAFGAVVSTAPIGKRVMNLPRPRVVFWGTVVAAIVPLMTGKVLPEVLIMAPLGAVSAIVSVAIARKSFPLPLA